MCNCMTLRHLGQLPAIWDIRDSHFENPISRKSIGINDFCYGTKCSPKGGGAAYPVGGVTPPRGLLGRRTRARVRA